MSRLQGERLPLPAVEFGEGSDGAHSRIGRATVRSRVVISPRLVAMYCRSVNPGRRHSRETFNAPDDFLSLACRCAVLL